jgi:hypothetical protein
MYTSTLVRDHSTNANATTSTGTRATKDRAAFIEVTVGPTPQQLMRNAVSALSAAPMRSFLADFFDQPEIQAILKKTVGVSTGSELRRYTIQILRSAAETAAYSSSFGAAEREALYVATFIEGCRPYLAYYLAPGSTVDDVLYTLVHEGLSRLSRLGRQDERLASLVRMCLGLGLPDEIDDFYVPRLRLGVQRALKRAKPASFCI